MGVEFPWYNHSRCRLFIEDIIRYVNLFFDRILYECMRERQRWKMCFVNHSGRDRWPHILAQRDAIKIEDVTLLWWIVWIIVTLRYLFAYIWILHTVWCPEIGSMLWLSFYQTTRHHILEETFIHEPVDVVVSSQLQIIKSFKKANASYRSSVNILIYAVIQNN